MRTRQSGQATVELVALLPLLAIVLAATWQLVLAGHAMWAATVAARAAARAGALGADSEAAARRRLPARLRRGLRVAAGPGGDVRVSVAVPAVLRGVRPGRVSAGATFAAQEPGP
jgi:hypothetical protein